MPNRVIPDAQFAEPGWAGARCDRVVIHWTAGAYRVSALDKKHYHGLISVDGDDAKFVPGKHTPKDNENTGDGDYAAHTRGLNTRSFGLSVACMAGAKEGGPYGSAPLTKVLWERLAQAAADVVAAYDLALSERTVLQHGEVFRIYGKPQSGKWDCVELPFEPSLSHHQVCEGFRRKVQFYLTTYHGG